MTNIPRHGSVAQSGERRPPKPQDEGSSPSRPAVVVGLGRKPAHQTRSEPTKERIRSVCAAIAEFQRRKAESAARPAPKWLSALYEGREGTK